jgi:hypothetical protein
MREVSMEIIPPARLLVSLQVSPVLVEMIGSLLRCVPVPFDKGAGKPL